jgi:geranylgeranyl diphosphate synthase, type II
MVGPSATLLDTQGAAALDSLTDWTKTRRADIDRALDEFTQFDSGCPSELVEPIRYSLLAPGKRLRPLLVLMACEACGCDYGRAMPAAAAVEMIHTYSLIHDDLPAMDDDDLRRGRPTCHKAFNEASAILAGDALLAYAFEMLTKLESPPAIVAKCCSELAKAAGPSQLVGGQAADLAAEGAEGNVELLEAIHRRKTGAMFVVSLRLGGLVGEASGPQLAALTTYGQTVGLAFQIVDDLLDCEVSTEEMGKRTQKDTKKGKLTFPRLLGVAESRWRAQQLIEQGVSALAPLGSGGERLCDLAKYILERKR